MSKVLEKSFSENQAIEKSYIKSQFKNSSHNILHNDRADNAILCFNLPRHYVLPSEDSTN